MFWFMLLVLQVNHSLTSMPEIINLGKISCIQEMSCNCGNIYLKYLLVTCLTFMSKNGTKTIIPNTAVGTSTQGLFIPSDSWILPENIMSTWAIYILSYHCRTDMLHNVSRLHFTHWCPPLRLLPKFIPVYVGYFTVPCCIKHRKNVPTHHHTSFTNTIRTITVSAFPYL